MDMQTLKEAALLGLCTLVVLSIIVAVAIIARVWIRSLRMNKLEEQDEDKDL